MAKDQKRYWVYSHDAQGEIISNHGEANLLKDAIDIAAHELVHLYPQYTGVTIRVVDNEADSTTVWLAGPVEIKKELDEDDLEWGEPGDCADRLRNDPDVQLVEEGGGRHYGLPHCIWCLQAT